MRLAVFDIDGTLTELSPESDVCFVRAIKSLAGSTDLSENWREYTHVSDSGILDAIFRKHVGRPPTAEEDRTIQERYAAALAADGVETRPLPGALAFFEMLRMDDEWNVAIATGNWLCAARWKLERAGFAHEGLAMATANDAMARADILRTAVERAGLGDDEANRPVYLGDGTWDREAAKEAGIPFIAVGNDVENDLRLHDYLDPERALAVLHRALDA